MKANKLRFRPSAGLFVGVVLAQACFTNPSFSQAPFYQGKTITLVIGSEAGGAGDLRARALAASLLKHIPGNPSIVFQYMPGGGGRRAANYIYNTARPDGLTMLRVASSIVPYAVLGEGGVQYDIDRLIYLGTTEHVLYYLFYTRREAGLNSLEKLRATPGVRIGSEAVGHTGYLLSRAMAYLLGMNKPQLVPGYGEKERHLALMGNEVDATVNTSGAVVRNPELIGKGLVDFHAAVEIPKGWKDPRFAHLRLPDIESFAKSEKERKLLAVMRGFRGIGTVLVLPPGTPKERMEILKDAARKTYTDPDFYNEYRKLTGGDEPSPLTPEEQVKIVRELPRDPEILELYKRIAGMEPLPPR